jgi:hypothetical protein
MQMKSTGRAIGVKSVFWWVVGVAGVVSALTGTLSLLKTDAPAPAGVQSSVVSYNQSGGITAQNVTIEPTIRHMSDQVGQEIRLHIPTSAKVSVTSVLGDSESMQFATEVLQWLRANGYSRASGVDQAVYSVPVSGQHVEQKSSDEYEVVIGSRR